MSLLRCIAILAIFIFSVLTINPVFAAKFHGDGSHVVPVGGGQFATYAAAYAQATNAADAGSFSIYAQVDSNVSDDWGHYQGVMWKTVSAISVNPNPFVLHISSIN